ncbi:hypothetical protein BESB_078040 [Besnoitia besnoiti]|uniref:Uncharacterized protein n=1 Tax=Besnoitia besnoiti TaxID=94643 RepID=A0A2A9MDA0_BESBE|nr:hypothetical protein BESB_078040 [Besnoitia besnoiti]PFH33587.1 hypothetical protein BESB_078040 [Besnoitia besnoiti]
MVRWPLSQAAIGSRQSASACEKPPLFCTRVGVARASRFCSKSSDVEGHQGGPAPGGCSARAAPSPTHIFAASSSRGFSSLPLLDAAVDASTSASSSGLTSDSLSRFLTQCVNQLLPGAASSAALSLSRFALPALSQTETGVFLSFATRCRGGDDLARSSVSMAISAVGPSVCLGGQEARVHARGERRAEDESGAQELCEKLFSSQIFRVGEDATSCRPAVRLWRAVPGRCALKGSGVAAPTTGDVPDGAGEGTRFLKQSPVFEEASHLVGRQKNMQETGRWAAGAAAEPVRVFSVETLKDLIGKWWIQLWKGNRWKGPQRNKWKWYHRHGYWATRKKLIDFTKYRRYGYHERRGLGKPRMQFWENPSHHKRLKKAIRFW